MTLRFGDRIVPLPDSVCWDDPPEVWSLLTKGRSAGKVLPHARKGRRRPPGHWTRGIVLHTTTGTVATRVPGALASVGDWLQARFMASTDRSVSWHCTVDLDGSVVQSAGPDWTCWHASQVNDATDGFELVAGPTRCVTGVQLDRLVELCDRWTFETGVPRVIPWRDGKPFAGLLTRALSAHGAGQALCGVYGHRNVWGVSKTTGHLVPYRGHGDPSDEPFYALKAAGYLCWDLEDGEDLRWWKATQARLGLEPDGIPGPKTRRAMVARDDWPGPLLVTRPGDREAGTPAWLRDGPMTATKG